MTEHHDRSAESAVARIAKFATSTEMQASVDAECAKYPDAAQWHASAELADFRSHYDECIKIARATASPDVAQPVAWRYQRKVGWGDIWRSTTVPVSFETPNDWTIQPLYASQPSPAATVETKADWCEMGSDGWLTLKHSSAGNDDEAAAKLINQYLGMSDIDAEDAAYFRAVMRDTRTEPQTAQMTEEIHAPAAKVISLGWEERTDGKWGDVSYWADHQFGCYAVERDYFSVKSWELIAGGRVIGNFDSVEAAQISAQENFEDRVRSCLLSSGYDPTTQPYDEPFKHVDSDGGVETCSTCGRMVLMVNQPATGFIAPCGRRMVNLSECGATPGCGTSQLSRPESK